MGPHPASSRPRSPGIVFAVVALALVVMLATIALTSRTSPPPTIAEFAPQAVEQITDVAHDLHGGKGGDQVAADDDRPVGASSGPRSAIVVPRVRRCVGDPPRQIDDPQSPPCVPYWDGDNGGGTSRGVTRSEVRVVVPVGNTLQQSASMVESFASFFNSRFEFYGRQLRLIPTTAGAADDAAVETSEAVDADERYAPFASAPYNQGTSNGYHAELARRGIIATLMEERVRDERQLGEWAPYVWSYIMATDPMLRSLGRWACARLAGGNAVHAGDPLLQGRRRAFGIIVAPSASKQSADVFPSLEPLTSALRTCHADPVAVYNDPNMASGDDAAITNTMIQMQSAGVTSVFCLCRWHYLISALPKATQQGFFPEWLSSTYGGLDNTISIKLATAGSPIQARTFLGVTSRPREQLPENRPYVWALKEVGAYDTSRQDGVSVFEDAELYRSLLLLASGVQLAGPQLTPETFERGLHRASFPNPEHPIMAGKVGFQGGSHAMTIDGAEWWYDVSARSSDAADTPGAICYVDGGARHTHQNWSSGGNPFFRGLCDHGTA